MSMERLSSAALGDVLAGKYRVERVIGEGAMGVVVLATDLSRDARVAIKWLRPELASNSEMVKRFLRESRSAARLTSEHVTRVLDVGSLEGGTPFMVMEYLEGRDLEFVLERQGTLSISQAIDLILQTCDAVAEAHAIDIVHRDIKPQNLFLAHQPDCSNFVKVLDFGISKVKEEADEALTQASTMLGSPLYMSPEQMRSSANVDPRSDIWSLGVVLYQMLTGTVPFCGESLIDHCRAVSDEQPVPPDERRPDVPAELSKVVLRCLEKDREHRYSDIWELAEALEAFRDVDGPPASIELTSPSSRKAPLPAAQAPSTEPAPPPEPEMSGISAPLAPRLPSESAIRRKEPGMPAAAPFPAPASARAPLPATPLAPDTHQQERRLLTTLAVLITAVLLVMVTLLYLTLRSGHR